MAETILMDITYDPTYDTIDYNIKLYRAAVGVMVNRTADVAARLRMLADALEQRKHPFQNIDHYVATEKPVPNRELIERWEREVDFGKAISKESNGRY